MDTVLSTTNLSKKYGNYFAVNNVNIEIRRGEIYGLVGLNGAGKTTFIRLISGLIKPDGGDISLFGSMTKKEFLKSLNRLGAIIETPSLYQNLTAADNVKVHADIKGIKYNNLQIKELLEKVNLDYTLKKSVSKYSLGMRQRLGIAVSLIGSPEFLILDEPTNGLDPEGIFQLRNMLQQLKEAGVTILISSHILSELSKIATRFGFFHNGKLIYETKLDKITAEDEDLEKYFIRIIGEKNENS